MAATITLVKTAAAGVANAPPGDMRIFADSADSIVKTKDEFGVVRPAITGLATDLATTGDSVIIDSGAAPSPSYVLVATAGPVSPVATWQEPRAAKLGSQVRQTAVQTGVIPGTIGQLIRVDISGGNATVNLPTAVGMADQEIWVKVVTTAGGNTCTLTPLGLQTIDGAPSLILTTDYEWANLRSDNANWMQIG